MTVQAAAAWRVGPDRRLGLLHPRLMGVLNVTPDSFSDGGMHRGIDEAVAHALQMERDGACMIDVGGESTRPGSQAVAAEEQIRRTRDVIALLRERSEVLISIDTTRAQVAKAALDAGADIINDVSAGRDDEAMLALAASRGCGLVLMHRLRRPHEDRFSNHYAQEPDYGGDVVTVVREFLMQRVNAAMHAGVARQSIVIDPGLGFGKSVAQNFELIRRTGELAQIGLPVLSGASRKSFVGAASSATEPAQRLAGSLAVSVAHFLAGVRLFRVHDVAAHRQALAVAEAVSHPLDA